MSSSSEVRSPPAKAGKELRRLGINVDFAPVADVSNGSTSILQGRVFRGGYGQVVADVQGGGRALRPAGVVPPFKPSPGRGAALDSTDKKPVAIGGTRDQL